MDHVRELVADRVRELVDAIGAEATTDQLLPGKMLRTRFAQSVFDGSGDDAATASRACAAIELAHTASLCHDDVIDNALVRRTLPAVWRVHSASAAILIGDALLCESLSFIASIGDMGLLRLFLERIYEVCRAEARQELLYRGTQAPPDQCLELARGKTGALFAFAGRVAAGADSRRVAAAEEAGYCIGTAYQLADDLLDIIGMEKTAGKTLGTDQARGKYTLPSGGAERVQLTAKTVDELLNRAIALLAPWPTTQASVGEFLDTVLRPLLDALIGPLNLEPTVGIA